MRRRLNAWGFEGESFPPPRPMRKWLERQVGKGERRRPVDPMGIRLPGPRSLPELPVAGSMEHEERLLHARGRGFSDLVRLRTGALPAVPDAVVWPADPREVEAVLRTCSRAGVRVIPWGGGTSVTGGVNTQPGSEPTVVMDLERLSGLKGLDERSGLATFGAGTLGPRLEASLADHGLTLGHFPQSWELSTVGGWAATRSSGQESLGYGSIQDMVAGLELVAPGGRLSLPPLPASAAGPDLRQLVMGSEGRLGVITEVTVRVRRRPKGRTVEALLLPSWEDGVEALRDLAGAGIAVNMLRLSDPAETAVALAVGMAGHLWSPLARLWLRLRGIGSEGCLLFCGMTGRGKPGRWKQKAAAHIARRHGAVSLGDGPGRHWLADRFRHPYLRDALFDLGYATETLETAATWSALPRVYRAVSGALAAGLPGDEVPVLCHISHVYPDGVSLYFTFFFRCPHDPEEAIASWAVLKRSASDAIARSGGTISHHHGVGSWHAPWLAHEAGEAGVRILAAAAREMDPKGILNPHVLLDPSDRLEV